MYRVSGSWSVGVGVGASGKAVGGGSDDWGAQGVRHFVNCIKR